MPWFKVDDGMHKSRKRIRLGRSIEGWAALGLWAHLGSWSADELTEGFISDDDLEYHAPGLGADLAKRLEAVGLFERVTRYGHDGWQFHDWEDFQPAKEQVLAERAATAERQRRFRERVKANREEAAKGTSPTDSEINSNGVTNGVTNGPVTVSPTRPDPFLKELPSEVPSQSVASLPPSNAKAPKRAQRIPDDFQPSREMVGWAAERCPGVDGRRETEKFKNYWRAKSGRDATKLDWPATWRNWMLNAADRGPSGRASPTPHKPYQNPQDTSVYLGDL
jgi:hypothetical protein